VEFIFLLIDHPSCSKYQEALMDLVDTLGENGYLKAEVERE
jgi:hypothetical protein